MKAQTLTVKALPSPLVLRLISRAVLLDCIHSSRWSSVRTGRSTRSGPSRAAMRSSTSCRDSPCCASSGSNDTPQVQELPA